MIKSIDLLHYLSEDTYKKICHQLNLSNADHKTKNNYICLEGQKICRIDMFNILYKQFGHIWFMSLHIDFPQFDCAYEAFEPELYKAYHELFGKEIMADFPTYDQITCGYIEFSELVQVENADKRLAQLHGSGKFVPEQLERSLWNKYKRPHNTIEFCLCKKDDTHLLTLARCHSTALKQRVKDKIFHGPVGIRPMKIVNKETEQEIMAWLYKKYGVIYI